jgi:hypothetical protein
LEHILTATVTPLKLQRPEIWSTAKGRRVVLNDGSRGSITGRVVKAFVPVWVHLTNAQPKQLLLTLHNSSNLHITAEIDEWITWAGMRGRITKSDLLALEDEFSGSALADELVDKMLRWMLVGETEKYGLCNPSSRKQMPVQISFWHDMQRVKTEALNWMNFWQAMLSSKRPKL